MAGLTIAAALGAAALGGTAIGAEASPESSMPGWMAGAWIEAKGDGWTEEFWTTARGGLMLGAGRNGKGATLNGWEVMRIEAGKDGKIAFLASPEGAPPVRFALVSAGPQEVVFANPAHDYPQRIRYWRDGRLLIAEISLADGSKAMRWTYRPMGE